MPIIAGEGFRCKKFGYGSMLMNSRLLIHDPIYRGSNGSHNSDVLEFIVSNSQHFHDSVEQVRVFTLGPSNIKILARCKKFVILILNVLLVWKVATKNDNVPRTIIINPNQDPVSLLSLLIIRKLSSSKWQIYSRFIGTHDRIFYKERSWTALITSFLVKNLQRDSDKYACETQSYSRILASRFNVEVMQVPYPPIDIYHTKAKRISEGATFYSPGSARKDKGFEELPQIINSILDKVEDAVFYIQVADSPWAAYQKTLIDLKAISQVHLLPAHISKEEMSSFIGGCDVLLLPYAPEEFSIRGSSFCQRGLYLGKKIYSKPGTSLMNEAKELKLDFEFNNHLNRLIIMGDMESELAGYHARVKSKEAWESFLK